jgi:hypothetical protein
MQLGDAARFSYYQIGRYLVGREPRYLQLRQVMNEFTAGLATSTAVGLIDAGYK